MAKKHPKKQTFAGSKELIHIDQVPIRNQAILNLEMWNNKIDLIEDELQKFQETEVKLYNDWLNLTTRKLQSEIMLLYEKYEKIGRFNNWFVLISEELNITLIHAYFLMREEESKYQRASNIEKEEIEKNREMRDKKISEKMKSQYFEDIEEEQDFPDNDSEQDKDKSSDQFNYNEREKHFQQNRKKFNKELKSIEKMSEQQILKSMKSIKLGVEFITEVILICIQCNRFDLVEKYWRLTPEKIKVKFNLEFKSQMGCTLDIFIEEVKNENFHSDQQSDGGDGVDLNSDTLSELINDKNDLNLEEQETAKIIYRKVMMKIHPDKLTPEFALANKKWLEYLWKKIQNAYDKSDILALQTLRLQILVKLKHYDELDLSELKLASKLLEADFNRICLLQSDIINHPAWGFSKLNSYKHLEKKVSEPYKANLRKLKKEIKVIEKQHAAISKMADMIVASGGFGPIKVKKSKKKRKTKLDSDWPY